MSINRMHQPIPLHNGVNGWQQVPIQECGEPLVSLNQLSGRISIRPAYALQGIPHALDEMYLRAGAAEKLAQAADGLPPGYKLLVLDAWRPVAVQEYLFEDYARRLGSSRPELTEAGAREAAKRFVSLPSLVPECPSPHLTGGAVDLTFTDGEGREVEMGSAFDEFTDRSQTRYFEEEGEQTESLSGRKRTESLSVSGHAAMENRRLLYHTMVSAGFTNYPEEWWHYDFGNQFWGKSGSGRTAFYGMILLN